MAQRQFRSDDTSPWQHKYGHGLDGNETISANTTFSTANQGLTVAAGSKAATLDAAGSFSNGDLVLLHQSRGTGAGLWEFNRISSGAGTTSITLESNATGDYADDGDDLDGANQGQILAIKQYVNFTVNAGISLTADTFNGSLKGIIPIFATTSITVAGNIIGTEKGYNGGRASENTNSPGETGEGYVGRPHSGTSTPQGNGGGGGGPSGSPSDPGAGGGNATAGSNGASGDAEGGLVAGNAGLTNMVNGGGGGGSSDSGNANKGGRGGCILILVSPKITVTGTIPNNGVAGAGGGGKGAGGGAGGSTLFKGIDLVLGDNLVTASAGSGGSVGGGNGSVGRIHADYLNSISGTTTPSIDSRQDTSLGLSHGGFLFNLL